MKIQTKNSVFDLELDGISPKGKIKFADGSKMKLREIYNWLDVLAEFVEDIVCFDNVAYGGFNGLVLLETLYISPDDPMGELSNSLKKTQLFLDAISTVGVCIDDIIYHIGLDNEYLSCELHFVLE